NLTNIIIYLKLGLKDSISICFFVLSCTDLVCIMILIVSDTVLMLAEMFRERWRVDGEDLCWFTMYYYGAVYDVSQGITTFIAVQKCWCVALPFRFKDTFTTTRTFAILTGICLAIFSIHMPILASQDIVEMVDPVRNRTLFKLWTSGIRAQAYSAVGLISLVFTTTCQVTVVFCLVVLASGLRASSKFRNSSTSANPEQTSLELKNRKIKSNGKPSKNGSKSDKLGSRNQNANVQHDAINSPKNAKISSAPGPVNNTSRKELQALQSATFVSVLFVVCNTFKLLNYYVILCLPDFSPFGRYVNIYQLANDYRFTVEAVHMASNVLVYLKFNTRFR
ncbi:unnamed protein product, partial [Lymnaea stagnalis]